MKHGEVETRKLDCQLSPSERDAKTADLVRLEQAESKQKAAKKEAVSEMNAQLKQVRAQIDQVVKELDEGAEVREVEVEAVFDYEAKRVDYLRRDTGAVVSSRDMDSYDLQEQLPGHEQDVLPPPSKPQKRSRKKKHGELNDLPDNVA
jgi:Asp-tRNA(Asn)/Glu-tRNA(Gln) amidotransferase A subunit family amidase